MSQVTVKRGIFGDVVVSVSKELWPLSDLLQTDMVQFPELLLAEAIEAAGEPGQEWSSGGNAYWIEIEGERVTVSNQVTEEEVTLPREQFLEILRDFQRALADLRTAES